MALKPGSPRQMCHVHLTGTRMPFLHLGNLGDVRLDFAAQLLQVLLAMWKPRNVWCCLKEDMDQRFAQLLLFFSVKLNYEAGSILNQHCAEKHVSLRWPLHTIASTSNWMEMSQKMYTLCTNSTIERCRGLVYKRTVLFWPGQTKNKCPVV